MRDFQVHANELTDDEFTRFYRVTRGRFTWLYDKLRSKLALRRSRISVEIKMAITLRYLAGGEYLDIREMWGIRTQTFYTIIEHVIPQIAAIKNPDCPSLEDILKMENPSQKSWHLHQIGMSFAALTSGVFEGCVGCIDGLCIRILRPLTGTTLPRVPNPSKFYNRKGFYALSMQGVCDAKRRIRSATIMCPGSVHDSLAYACSTLAFLIREGNLPQGLFLNGDDAYACDEQMVTPYPGRGLSVEKDSFNFYQSRVRINIECAFGMLHARWGILWKPIQIRLDRFPTLIGALVVLHNMCIDDQGSQHSPSMDGACFSLLAGEDDAAMAPTSQGSVYSDYVEAAAVSGARRDLERCTQREIMSFMLAQNKMRRPAHSKFSYM